MVAFTELLTHLFKARWLGSEQKCVCVCVVLVEDIALINSPNNHFLNFSHVPGTVLGSCDTAGNQAYKSFYPCTFIDGKVKVKSCLTLCNPMDCGSPGSSVHGIFQARVLEWVAISFSKESS